MDLSQSKGEWKIERATHVPLTLGGKAKFMIANVLAATLASYVWGFKTEDISLSLQTFKALLKHQDE
jgi:cyanophycin synthetase